MGLRVEYLDTDVIRWEQLQDTFAQYTAIVGAATVQPGSVCGVPVLAGVPGAGMRPYAQRQGAPRWGRAAAAVMTSDKDPAEEPAKGLDPAAVEAWVI
jgi:hypothetical protein